MADINSTDEVYDAPLDVHGAVGERIRLANYAAHQTLVVLGAAIDEIDPGENLELNESSFVLMALLVRAKRLAHAATVLLALPNEDGSKETIEEAAKDVNLSTGLDAEAANE